MNTKTQVALLLIASLGLAGACSSNGGSTGGASAGGSSGGLGSGGGTTGGAANCASNQVACGNSCVDEQNDPQNCGGCGMACASGQACAAGACVATCTGSNGTLCGGNCVDLATDEANCGSCGHACPSGEACANKQCGATAGGCTAPLTACGSGELPSCVNLQTDAQDCGTCGNACPSGQACSAGKCQACASGQTSCSGTCTNTSSDSKNCGTCGTACGSGLACTNGQCQTCATGETSCGGSCTNTQTDGNNCGGCADAGGHVCSSAQSCQTGACVEVCNADAGLSACGAGAALACTNLATDPDNCGACGHGCGSGLGCDGGSCNCGAGEALCGSGSSATCIDTASDPNNCGACNRVCASELCHLGTCLYCPAGSFAFGPLVLIDAGSVPGYVGIADFNRDGRADLGAANSGDGTLGVILGLDGGFAPQVTFNPALDTPVLAIDDVNGDGLPDVATLSNQADAFSLLLNQTFDGGGVKFGLQGPFACQLTQNADTLAIADVNEDGRPDVIVGGSAISFLPPGFTGTLDVFLQTDAGFPATSSSTVVVGQSVAALTSVRLGGDGGLALASVDNVGNAVVVLAGAGILSSQATYAVGNAPVSIATGDLNGDGISDLTVLNQSDKTVSVLTGQAGGTFSVGTPVSVVASSLLGFALVPQWVTVGDVNGDGVPDIVVAIADLSNLGGDVVTYLINQGNATFAPPVSVPAAASGFSPSSVIMHDINGDGLPDLALGNEGSGDFVGVLYGQCP